MRKNIKIGIDCDDVLYSCNEYALDLINKSEGQNLKMEDITSWNLTGNYLLDKRLDYFKDPNFFVNQPILSGAKEFIKELHKFGELFICSAIDTNIMTIRGNRLKRDFPSIDEKNIILGARKDIYDLTFLIDDSPNNIKESNVDFPILFRRPWNSHMAGMLSVNNYQEAISMIKHILEWQTEIDEIEKNIYVLVGCSGSGKTEIQNKLIDKGLKKIQSTTTRKARKDDKSRAYNYISKELFKKMIEGEEFLEYSIYAGEYYGTTFSDICNALEDKDNKYVAVLDISGAIALRSYSDKVRLIFVDRDDEDIISSIISRDISNEDKTKRIISIPFEKKNKNICDYVVNNRWSIEKTVENVLSIIKK